jgi:hypothetical protein
MADQAIIASLRKPSKEASMSFDDVTLKPPGSERPKFLLVVPNPRAWHEGPVSLFIDDRYVCGGTSRDALSVAVEHGIQTVGRYFIQATDQGKEFELQLRTKAERDSGVTAILAIRKMPSEVNS